MDVMDVLPVRVHVVDVRLPVHRPPQHSPLALRYNPNGQVSLLQYVLYIPWRWWPKKKEHVPLDRFARAWTRRAPLCWCFTKIGPSGPLSEQAKKMSEYARKKCLEAIPLGQRFLFLFCIYTSKYVHTCWVSLHIYTQNWVALTWPFSRCCLMLGVPSFAAIVGVWAFLYFGGGADPWTDYVR